MAYTQADLDALDAKIASGVEEVRYADRSLRNTPMGDLLKARTVVANELAKANRTSITRQILVVTDKGFGGGGNTDC